jgi:hypothetical protein
MSLYSILGMVSAIALLVPTILILAFKLFSHRSFLALSVYYLIAGVYNLITQNAINAPLWFSRPIGISNNLLDAPLMLLFLIFFSTSAAMTKRIRIAMFIFIGFEVIMLAIFGFSIKTVKIILGPDIAIITILSFLFFLRNVRLAITNQKSLGKAVMTSSVLLSYTIFSLVYVFYYLIKNKQYREDAQLVYYLVTILSTILMSVGIIIENKRIKKLGELRNTRKELASLYGEKKVNPFNKDNPFLRTQ